MTTYAELVLEIRTLRLYAIALCEEINPEHGFVCNSHKLYPFRNRLYDFLSSYEGRDRTERVHDTPSNARVKFKDSCEWCLDAAPITLNTPQTGLPAFLNEARRRILELEGRLNRVCENNQHTNFTGLDNQVRDLSKRLDAIDNVSQH